MTNSEFPQDVLQQGKWCHLSGLFWVAVLFVCSPLGYLLIRANVLGALSYEMIYALWVGLILVFLALACPFLSSFVTAWLFWRTHRTKHPFVDDCGRAATNFQATVSLYGLCALLVFGFLFFVTCGPMLTSSSWYGSSSPGDEARLRIGLAMVVLGPLISFFWCCLQILIVMTAANKAQQGQMYVYPLSRQFFS